MDVCVPVLCFRRSAAACKLFDPTCFRCKNSRYKDSANRCSTEAEYPLGRFFGLLSFSVGGCCMLLPQFYGYVVTTYNTVEAKHADLGSSVYSLFLLWSTLLW